MTEKLSLREAYGRKLVELGKANPDIVVLDADLSQSTMTKFFAKEFPDRFFDCGIAEQNMISIAAGLAAAGKTPFASTFSVFAPGRSFDQIRMSVAYSRLNVKLVATHGGVSVGEDGASHQAIEDLALVCSLPGFNVIVPADAAETESAVETAARTEGPFYIRVPRPKMAPIYTPGYTLKLGKADILRQGDDAAIIATGVMVQAALDAADSLTSKGMNCRVLNMSTLKPLDEEAVMKAAETGAIVTAEDHLQHGGLGAQVAQLLAEKRPTPMEFVAVKDTYARSGKPAALMARYGLTAADIERAVERVLQRKQP